MKPLHKLAALAAASATVLLLATPAAAIPIGENRTWVSGFGDNFNPCSRLAPCKTFDRALKRTAPGGEIDCLDAGGFGAVTIDKAVTIDCSAAGHMGGVLAAGDNGIVVNPGAGVYVQLINLDINGLGTGLSGVLVESGVVAIDNTYIHGFRGGANCGVTGGAGVCVSGPAGTKATIDNATIRDNSIGVINNPGAGANTVNIYHSVLDSNGSANVQAVGAGAKLYLNGDVLINCPVAISNSGGLVISFGNNAMTGTVAPLSSQTLQ